MKLVIILICLGLERYFSIGERLKRFAWFENYLTQLRRLAPQEIFWNGWAGVALICLPPVLALAAVYHLFAGWLFGLVGLMVSVFVLLYCLGPDDLYHQLSAYFAAVDAEDKEQENALKAILINGPVPKEKAKANRALTIATFINANERLFAVLFWFIVLGPAGAALYRLIALLNQKAKIANENISSMADAAKSAQALLDWLPARITAITYALMGNFSKSFPAWMKTAGKGLDSNDEVLTQTGLLALGVAPDDIACATVEENREVMFIIDRALVVILLIIAGLTLAAWIS